MEGETVTLQDLFRARAPRESDVATGMPMQLLEPLGRPASARSSCRRWRPTAPRSRRTCSWGRRHEARRSCSSRSALSRPSPSRRAAVELRPVNVAGYPRVATTVVVPRVDSPAPQITENGRPVEGYRAVNLGSDKAIVLAIDRSQSMFGQPLREASLASAVFVGAKDWRDRIAVHVFGWQAIALTGFSQATIDADTALRALSVDDEVGTALYDQVVLAAGSLNAQPQRARVLVLLTDGRDLGSLARLPSAVRAARRAGVIVYPIAIGSADARPLRTLATATGGRLYTSASTATLADVFPRIENELKRTWAVSYATTARPGDAIVVRAEGEGGQATLPERCPGKRRSASARCSRRRPRQLALSLALAALAAILLGAAVVIARRKPRSAHDHAVARARRCRRGRPRSHDDRERRFGGLFAPRNAPSPKCGTGRCWRCCCSVPRCRCDPPSSSISQPGRVLQSGWSPPSSGSRRSCWWLPSQLDSMPRSRSSGCVVAAACARSTTSSPRCS